MPTRVEPKRYKSLSTRRVSYWCRTMVVVCRPMFLTMLLFLSTQPSPLAQVSASVYAGRLYSSMEAVFMWRVKKAKAQLLPSSCKSRAFPHIVECFRTLPRICQISYLAMNQCFAVLARFLLIIKDVSTCQQKEHETSIPHH